MPTKDPRRLRRFTLNEISVVADPAVQDALVAAIRKSADNPATKAAAMTSEAQGHRHPVLITGAGASGLDLVLGEYRDAAGLGHTHPTVRVRGGWQVGLTEGHGHTIPALNRVIAALLESDPAAEDYNVGKGQNTTVTDGHSHIVDVDSGGALVVAKSGAGGDGGHVHAVTKDHTDGSLRLAPAEDGHTHYLPAEKELRKLAGTKPASDPASTSTEKGDMLATPLEKAKIAKATAEGKLDALAAECHADHADLTPEQAYARALLTAKGRKLWKSWQDAHNAVDRARVAKSQEQVDFEKACDKRIDELAAKETRKWASETEANDIREATSMSFYQSEAYRIMENEFQAREMAKHQPPEPELVPVTLGLLSKAEVEADPERALEKLATIEAYRQGITTEQATAGFVAPESVGHEILKRAHAAQQRRSAAASTRS